MCLDTLNDDLVRLGPFAPHRKQLQKWDEYAPHFALESDHSVAYHTRAIEERSGGDPGTNALQKLHTIVPDLDAEFDDSFSYHPRPLNERRRDNPRTGVRRVRAQPARGR